MFFFFFFFFFCLRADSFYGETMFLILCLQKAQRRNYRQHYQTHNPRCGGGGGGTRYKKSAVYMIIFNLYNARILPENCTDMPCKIKSANIINWTQMKYIGQ